MRKILLMVVGVGLVVYGVIQHLANQAAEEELLKQLSLIEIESNVEIEYASVDVHLLSDKISVRGLEVKNAADQKMASVELMSMQGFRPDELSEFTEVRLNGVRLNKPAWQQPTTFPPLLLESRFDFAFAMAYEPDSGALEIKLGMDAKKVVSMAMSANFHNATPFMEAYHARRQQKLQMDKQSNALNSPNDSERMSDAWIQLEPRAFMLEVNSLGRLSDLLDQHLKNQGLDREAFKQMFTEQVYSADSTQKTKDALLAFADGLQRLHISAQLPEGMNFPSLTKRLNELYGQPEAAADFLNLKVEGS
ncbi:hypothetical protein [Pseudoalteromonas sp. T1lg23B]|uniref:hypothetical protein n=1 Tax=Pseudoalteromonas sp. T1lg23B TaxID=2077097 RepID=UPI000CF65357|nr:hypothetical protein [Pseudoalteromonas sp. T1lg23B]